MKQRSELSVLVPLNLMHSGVVILILAIPCSSLALGSILGRHDEVVEASDWKG